jgi:hypothetical protein
MRLIRTIFGLFVDDGALALGLLAWTSVIGLAVRFWSVTPLAVPGPALFLGYVAILIGNVAYAAHAHGLRRR